VVSVTRVSWGNTAEQLPDEQFIPPGTLVTTPPPVPPTVTPRSGASDTPKILVALIASACTGTVTGENVQPAFDASRVTVSPSSAKITAVPLVKVEGAVSEQVLPSKYVTGYGAEGWRALDADTTTPGDGPWEPTFERLSDGTVRILPLPGCIPHIPVAVNRVKLNFSLGCE
jgi:hypothetical protein